MRISIRPIERLLACGVAFSTAALLGAGVARGDESGARVTAVVGDAVTSGGRPIQNRSQIADDEKIALGTDGGCSILVDDDALVEMCEETSVVLERDDATGRRRIRVDAGQVRIVVEPRLVEERIEIHTPAAVATILGTIVHVAVDPATGETTITSTESRVRVASNDPRLKGSTTVGAHEQVSLKPGEAPPAKPRRLDSREIAELGGCLVDLHAAARDVDREGLQLNAVERIGIRDGVGAPWGGSPGPAAPALDPVRDIVDPSEVCSPNDCGLGELDPDPRARGNLLNNINAFEVIP